MLKFYILDILKSVYELRKSHAALANRPVTSQPFNISRRNIQSAVAPRKQYSMIFGGYLLPNQNDEQNSKHTFEDLNQSRNINDAIQQILEIDEFQ